MMHPSVDSIQDARETYEAYHGSADDLTDYEVYVETQLTHHVDGWDESVGLGRVSVSVAELQDEVRIELHPWVIHAEWPVIDAVVKQVKTIKGLTVTHEPKATGDAFVIQFTVPFGTMPEAVVEYFNQLVQA